MELVVTTDRGIQEQFLEDRLVRIYPRQYETTDGLNTRRVHAVVIPFTDLSDYVANASRLHGAAKSYTESPQGWRPHWFGAESVADMFRSAHLYFEIDHLLVRSVVGNNFVHTIPLVFLFFAGSRKVYAGMRMTLSDAEKGTTQPYPAEVCEAFVDRNTYSLPLVAQSSGTEVKALVNHGGNGHASYEPSIGWKFVVHRMAPSGGETPLAPPPQPFSYFLPA
jgi:hypothetical protein